MLRKENFLGVGITSESKENVLKYLLERIKDGTKKLFIVTPNPEILVYAYKHLAYKDKLNSADIALPDGVGVVIGSKLMGKEIKGRITGVDFIEELCKVAAELPLSIGFLGGRSEVAQRASECLKQKYPWIDVAFVGEEWPEYGLETGSSVGPVAKNSNRERKLGNSSTPVSLRLRAHSEGKKIDILFVAFGFPKQEEWIYENLEKLPVKAAMGVGGAFDYLSGNVLRAPKFLRLMGLEWFFRLVVQPWRLKRQLALLTFVKLMLQDKFGKKSTSK